MEKENTPEIEQGKRAVHTFSNANCKEPDMHDEPTDLKPVAKEKTLSDKINPCGYCDNDVRSKDVKEAVKKLKELCNKWEAYDMKEDIDKIFGDRLI